MKNTIRKIAAIAAAAAAAAGTTERTLEAQVARVTTEVASPVAQGSQTGLVVAHGVQWSEDGARLVFELSDGGSVSVAFDDGKVIVNGAAAGAYAVDGALAASWYALINSIAEMGPSEALDAVRAWSHDPIDAEQAEVYQRVASTVAELQAAEVSVAVGLPGPAIAPAAPMVIEIPDIDIQIPEIVIPQFRVDAVPTVPAAGSPSIAGTVAMDLLSLGAALVALTFMGLGYLFFAPRQLTSVADTAWQSFGRSFLTGLFAQPLLLPIFGAMIVGLALTVVGILIIPFAIPAFIAALLLAVTGGYVAIARSVGEIYLRRKTPPGASVQRDWVELRYIFVGLAGLLSIWLPAALFSWVPVMGTLLTVMAVLLTWVIATAGFGATILSRGGIRGTIVRRLDYALTDQRLWDTSPAITASSRSRAGW